MTAGSPSGSASVEGLAAAGSPRRRLLSPVELREMRLDLALMRLWPRRDLTVAEVAERIGECVKLARRRAQRLGLGRKPYATERVATERVGPAVQVAGRTHYGPHGRQPIAPPEHLRQALYAGRSYGPTRSPGQPGG